MMSPCFLCPPAASLWPGYARPRPRGGATFRLLRWRRGVRGVFGVSSERDICQARQVHMIGIGGSGMAAWAKLLLDMGKQGTGSDVSRSAAVGQVRAAGAVVFDKHQATNLGDDVEYVVRSSAVPINNPEVAEAERR